MEIRRQAKIKLTYTLRIDRLLAGLAGVCFLAVFLVSWGLALVAPALSAAWAFTFELFSFGLLLLAAPVWVVLANGLLIPVEKWVQRYYLGEAVRKIHQIRPTVVGITGSYGKTSTKEFLAHIHVSILVKRADNYMSALKFTGPFGLWEALL
jgi:UDP-N-acetylmuramoyl-tripeptide--D-alanyl-D-alanine ligase